MRICVLFGSPRRAGHTAQLLDAVLGQYPRAEVDRFDAYDMAVSPCIGCGACDKTGACFRRDDMDGLTAALEAADLILVAYPIYFNSIPAPLKAVIDRMQPRFTQTYGRGRRVEKRKKIYFLITAGSAVAEAETAANLLTLKFVANLWGARQMGCRVLANTDQGMPQELEALAQEVAAEIAQPL